MRGRAARLGTVAAVLGLLVACGAPLCPFAIVTRHPCPGCGLTRATLALAQGHLADALRLHPLSPVMAPLVIAALAYNAAIYVKDGRIAAAEGVQGAWVTRLGIALAVLMLAVWIARFLGALGGPVPV
ncbi:MULTISPECIES: DUF2752 domain-containing protein [Sorangium]|uniref:DUF2752 domain-containing protein n=1 Tax=Sorangium cellulosum (strain So ce56) TaxID=448385 RepID=A9EX91_SORC5|nr:DUF2752 domain-containing protein [Sorangium cellulosum]CAN94389.1 hypothetical protein sce4226 [Sorangium cellulosum So ce56]